MALALAWAMAGVPSAFGADVELAGIFGGKAVLLVDGGPPRTVAVGQPTPEGVRLLEVSPADSTAVVDVDGESRRVRLGQAPVRPAEIPSVAAVSLVGDAQGHHFTAGSINGASVRFLVDTGASMVSMGASDARRAGIEFRKGAAGQVQTANGAAMVWQVRLDSVRVGDITLNGVDALVHQHDLPFVLLGMSFLNRMDMQRMGDRLVLRKRY